MNSIEDHEPEWWKMAFGILKDDANKTRVARSVLVRVMECIDCFKRGDYPEGLEKMANVSQVSV